jgi:hypothetical protein
LSQPKKALSLLRDRDCVRSRCCPRVHPWPNGQTKGQITKLKLVKRQMYGRAKLDLLEARLVGAARTNSQNLHQESEPRLDAKRDPLDSTIL